MIGAVGLFSVLAGAIAATFAARFPAHVAAIETGAGVMLIGGFALATCALPVLL